MKIGIFTFHWVTNYGGVLQAYALQQTLIQLGFDVQIINYAPISHRDSILRCIKPREPKESLKLLIETLKERKFVSFRKNNLVLSKRYYTLIDLEKDPPNMDVYICGSDQVWHPLLAKSIGKPYYLSFGNENIIRIAYAASLASTTYPKEILDIVKPYLKKFQAISVRESSSVEILKDAGFKNVCLMPDPALLLKKEDINNLLRDTKKKEPNDFCFFYILQDNQVLINQLYVHLKQSGKIKVVNTKKMKSSMMSIEDWLVYIRNANLIVTNSFHGVIFSILFEKQFIAIPIEGKWSGSNDRILTLLGMLELTDRLLEKYDEFTFNKIISSGINWDKIQIILNNNREEAFDFLKRHIG